VLPDGLPGGGPRARRVLRALHAATRVKTRHTALPKWRYSQLDGFTDANNAFIEQARVLGERAVRDALAACALTPADVDAFMTVTVTGVSAPSLDALMHGRLGLRPDVKRVPVFGLGCVAGAAGVARLHDYLLGHPDDVAVLLSVELCSLSIKADSSVPYLVATGLFGDGAAAVVLVGEHRAAAMGLTGPAVLATRSRLYPDTERVMGWDVGSDGLRLVLSPSVPDVVESHIGEDVKGFLHDHDLGIADVAAWVSHPGGPKVLEAVQAALGLSPEALAVTWRSLERIGNLSSASVLFVLRDTLRDVPPPAGTPGLMLAMGPGFCSELVLLRW
jgi:alkylresorcinol/alkylpyrone synthase